MRLDDLLIITTALVSCFISSFFYGFVFQTVSIAVLVIFSVKSASKRQSQNVINTARAASVSSSLSHHHHQQSQNTASLGATATGPLSSAFVPTFNFGGVGLIFPILLASEKIYHLSHSIGYNTIPLYASVIWLWVALTDEERVKDSSIKERQAQLKEQQRASSTISTSSSSSTAKDQYLLLNGAIVLDRNRFELTALYSICMGILFSLLTMNIHIGLGCTFFITAAYMTETLLRTLFHEHRLSLRTSANAGDEIKVVDSEIHLVSTFVGWMFCDFSSNPFQENTTSANSRRTVVTASPEMIVGRTLFIAAVVGISIFGLYRLKTKSSSSSSTMMKSGSNGNNSSGALVPFIAMFAFVGVFSLLLTGWTCAGCFPDDTVAGSLKVKKPLQERKPPSHTSSQQSSSSSSGGEDFVRENQQFNNEEMQHMRNVTLQQRVQRTLQSLKDFSLASMKFTNPVWIWYKLLFDHLATSSASASSGSSSSNTFTIFVDVSIPLRIFWILLWGSFIPFLSAFPFIAQSTLPSFHRKVPRIVWRKWFHFVAVVSFVVASMTDSSFMALAWCGALALSAMIEVGRICDIPPLGKLTPLLESVTDDRDAVVLRTHWYLMLGCALPVIFFHRCVYFWSDNPHWLVYAACRILPGLGCLGIGDALSAVCGTLYGRDTNQKWAALFGTESKIVQQNPILRKKSRVGTILGGFFLTLVVCAGCIYSARLIADRMAGLPFSLENKFLIYGDLGMTLSFWMKAAVVIGFGSLHETIAGGVDNIEVPLMSLAVTFVLF